MTVAPFPPVVEIKLELPHRKKKQIFGQNIHILIGYVKYILILL